MQTSPWNKLLKSLSSYFAFAFLLTLATSASLVAFQPADNEIKLGDKIPNTPLTDLNGEKVELEKFRDSKRLIVVLLRGYPGYQCPLCTKQVADILKVSTKFGENSKLVFVYPGADKNLRSKAKQFVGKTQLPENSALVVDPNFAWTEAVGLRWQAANETSFPSTMIFSEEGTLTFLKISREHGDRLSGQELVDALGN